MPRYRKPQIWIGKYPHSFLSLSPPPPSSVSYICTQLLSPSSSLWCTHVVEISSTFLVIDFKAVWRFELHFLLFLLLCFLCDRFCWWHIKICTSCCRKIRSPSFSRTTLQTDVASSSDPYPRPVYNSRNENPSQKPRAFPEISVKMHAFSPSTTRRTSKSPHFGPRPKAPAKTQMPFSSISLPEQQLCFLKLRWGFKNSLLQNPKPRTRTWALVYSGL